MIHAEECCRAGNSARSPAGAFQHQSVGGAPVEIDRTAVREAFDGKPLIEVGGCKFVINPLTEQVPAATSHLLREAARWILEVGDFRSADKVVGEEDKGAIIVAAVSLLSDLPFGMARWYPSGLEGQVRVGFSMEYTAGTIYLNGVEEGDRVIIVDDMVSTGGTLVALVQAVRQAKAEVVDIICVAEKVEYGGVERVKRETGLDVKTLVRISMAGDRSRVLWPNRSACSLSGREC